MSVSVRFTCNGAGDGVPCESYVAVALNVEAFADGLAIDATTRLWLVETEWHDVPEGWRVLLDGQAFCPEHAAKALAA